MMLLCTVDRLSSTHYCTLFLIFHILGKEISEISFFIEKSRKMQFFLLLDPTLKIVMVRIWKIIRFSPTSLWNQLLWSTVILGNYCLGCDISTNLLIIKVTECATRKTTDKLKSFCNRSIFFPLDVEMIIFVWRCSATTFRLGDELGFFVYLTVGDKSQHSVYPSLSIFPQINKNM